jgi:hypothetical protein
MRKIKGLRKIAPKRGITNEHFSAAKWLKRRL